MTRKAGLTGAEPKGAQFVRWLDFELQHEDVTRKDGTIINECDPSDPGGLTFAGIDKASHPHFPYAHPTPDDVVAAYAADYGKVRAEELPSPVGLVVANFGVNMGSGEAIKLLQMALHVAVDGGIGSQTIAAAKAVESPLTLALKVVALADVHYDSLANNNGRLRKF